MVNDGGSAMYHLSLELFTQPFDDLERRQYEICAAIDWLVAQFRRNQLYPALQELIGIYRTLERVLQEHEQLHPSEQMQVLPAPDENRSVERSQRDVLEQLFELIRWAMPRLAEAIEEGAALFDFVEENISITSVGLLPMYTSEGYVLIPEHRTCTLHVLRYTSAQIVEHGDRYRALRTTEILSLRNRGVWEAPEAVKHRLIEQYPELPNPATFACETELDFPYAETILPVAKRKLMRALSER